MRDGGTARPGKGHRKAGAKAGSGASAKNGGRKVEPRRANGSANPGVRLLTVGGGKGGVGKSFVSANLAISAIPRHTTTTTPGGRGHLTLPSRIGSVSPGMKEEPPTSASSHGQQASRPGARPAISTPMQ